MADASTDTVLRSAALPRRQRCAARPTVSVCIANWNCQALLRHCLRSLQGRRQGLRVEIIVVDNASTDGAAEMVAREFPRVRLIRNAQNRGFATASNQAAQLARGRYLLFLNNDTIVPRRALRRLCQFLQQRPHVGIVGPLLRDGSGNVQASHRRKPTVSALVHRLSWIRWTGLLKHAYRRYRCRGGELDATRSVEILLGAALLMRRSVFEELGPWDEAYRFGGEDLDLCTRVGRHYEIVYHPEVEITHFGRVSSKRHNGFAHTNTLVGIARFLRTDGTPAWALTCYKAAVCLDAPVQMLLHAGEYCWRRLRGNREKASRSWRIVQGIGHFLRHGLWEFWRA